VAGDAGVNDFPCDWDRTGEGNKRKKEKAMSKSKKSKGKRLAQQLDDALAYGERLLEQIGAKIFGIDPLNPSEFHRLPASVRAEVLFLDGSLDGWRPNQEPLPGWTSKSLTALQTKWRASGREWRGVSDHVRIREAQRREGVKKI